MASAPPPAHDSTRTIVRAALLAFVAGFVDVVGFIGLFGLFTAHVTGNFVMIGVELVSSSQGVLAKVLALPVFAATVAVTTLAVSALQRRRRSRIDPLLATQAILLALFMLTGMAALPLTSADAPVAILAGMFGVAAMAVQNAESRLSGMAPTNIMTGNTTQVVIDLVQMWKGEDSSRTVARARLRRMTPVIITFAGGAILGALMFSRLSFLCLLAPIAVLAGLLVVARPDADSAKA
jgi:uncharacterized membrane protein YoaK (UPF0700 family)